MPPSPASRRSPGKEIRAENHKRGRSLEGGLLFQEKDDDLALFNEMQARERENFLLEPTDDFEDAFPSKLRHFGDHNKGISIPARGDSSDLLNVEGDKNDYEWLMTPPDTPLFPSLDDEPAPANTQSRGRTRSQPIAISRSSTMERSHRSSRGSASPSRSSPSPRSSSMGQSRGKPSSAPHTSPISSIRSATPPRRASPPPSKPSTPVPRSASPNSRRLSTGSNASAGNAGVRGMSPQKGRQGTSASPKVKAWQANIPGFSCDVPPNLRTSLADRPASYVRGSSPASRNGRDTSSKVNRQSMSPTATRSISSSYSHERDWFSSLSRGSIASSGDDDVDSLQSVTVGSMDLSTPRKVGTYSNNNRSLANSRRSLKISASAPKRSFDSVMRQMDNRKAPQNMFRPLLSSVPSTTFYAGKGSSTHSIMSRNSSVTTSSNASSDRGTRAIPDPEGNYYQDDIVGDSRKMLCPDIQEEVFAFDKEEEEMGNELYGDIKKSHMMRDGTAVSDDDEVNALQENTQVRDDLSGVDDLGSTVLCSLCGCSFDASDLMDMEIKLCQVCRLKENILDGVIPEAAGVVDNSRLMSATTPEGFKETAVVVSGSFEGAVKDEANSNRPHLWDESTSVFNGEVKEENVLNSEGEDKLTGGPCPPRGTCSRELEQFSDHSNPKITTADGAGISLLLKRSSSGKGHIVQGRALAASTILPYDDLSFVRETTTTIRSSIGHGSFSSSSSIDLSSSRQSDSRMHRQLSGKKSDVESYRYEVKSQSIGSSHSRNSSYSHHTMGLVVHLSDLNLESSAGDMHNSSAEAIVASVERLPGLEVVEAEPQYSSSNQRAFNKEVDSKLGESGRKVDTSALQLSDRDADVELRDEIAECSDTFHGTTTSENCENFLENSRNETALEIHNEMQNALPDACVNAMNEMAEPNGSMVSESEIEVHDCHQSTAGSKIVDISSESNCITDESQEPLKKDTNAITPEPLSSEPVVDVLGESTVTVESHGRNRTRSLTLEEATDAILFCSSIVHDLAYSAATIAIEKEKKKEKEALEALEGFRPTVTIVGKSTSDDRKDPRSGRIISKRGLKPHAKARQKRDDSDKKSISIEPENDENINESLTQNAGLPHEYDCDSMKPPKLESKCNCTIM